MEYFWARLFTNPIVPLRLLSLFTGIVGILAVYMLAARLFTHRAGLISALCIAMNSLHTYYSVEIRGYMLVFAFAAISGYCPGSAGIGQSPIFLSDYSQS